MPLFKKSKFALSKPKNKDSFKLPLLTKKNLERVLNSKETTQDGGKMNIQSPHSTSDMFSETSLPSPRNSSQISLNDPEIKKAYLNFVNITQPSLEDRIKELENYKIDYENLLSKENIKDSGLGKSCEFNKTTKSLERKIKKVNIADKVKKDLNKHNKKGEQKSKKKTTLDKKEKLKDNIRVPNKTCHSTEVQHKKNEILNCEKLVKKPYQGKSSKTSSKIIIPEKQLKIESWMDSKIYNKSVPQEGISHYEKMVWLQSQRNVGLFVYCDRCDKVRYLPDCKDPLDLPKAWFCSMNPNLKYNSCDIPEVTIPDEVEEDLIMNLYNAGSIVWARLDGFPWWPAMVDDDPDVEAYYWLEDNNNEPTWYHVTFFDSSNVTRAWLRPKDIHPFKNNTSNPAFLPAKFNKYKCRIDGAIKDAREATKIELIDRLKTFSFLSRYHKPINKPMKVSLKKMCGEKEEPTDKKKRKPKEKLDKNKQKIYARLFSSELISFQSNDSFDMNDFVTNFQF